MTRPLPQTLSGIGLAAFLRGLTGSDQFAHQIGEIEVEAVRDYFRTTLRSHEPQFDVYATEDIIDLFGGVVPPNAMAIGRGGQRYFSGATVTEE